MLVNSNFEHNAHVSFVDYASSSSALCYGVLTLEINGEKLTFGNKPDTDYPRFWESGGGVFFNNDYSSLNIEKGEWEIDVERLPEHLRCYAAEIDEVFNDNVPFGCCGGCA